MGTRRTAANADDIQDLEVKSQHFEVYDNDINTHQHQKKLKKWSKTMLHS